MCRAAPRTLRGQSSAHCCPGIHPAGQGRAGQGTEGWVSGTGQGRAPCSCDVTRSGAVHCRSWCAHRCAGQYIAVHAGGQCNAVHFVGQCTALWGSTCQRVPSSYVSAGAMLIRVSECHARTWQRVPCSYMAAGAMLARARTYACTVHVRYYISQATHISKCHKDM